jgi:membrane carboxypeptidase/penicillin-binding protein
VGYDQGKPANLYGGTVAGPIWASFIHDASAKLREQDFNQPAQVELLNICLDTGLVATEYCPRQSNMAFMKNNMPKDICYLHQPNMEWTNRSWWQWD